MTSDIAQARAQAPEPGSGAPPPRRPASGRVARAAPAPAARPLLRGRTHRPVPARRGHDGAAVHGHTAGGAGGVPARAARHAHGEPRSLASQVAAARRAVPDGTLLTVTTGPGADDSTRVVFDTRGCARATSAPRS
ncbi:hypothetical protein NKH77_48495 [Streptomyces sp. M19]